MLSNVSQRSICPELTCLWVGYRLAPAVGWKVGTFEGPVGRKVGLSFHEIGKSNNSIKFMFYISERGGRVGDLKINKALDNVPSSNKIKTFIYSYLMASLIQDEIP